MTNSIHESIILRTNAVLGQIDYISEENEQLLDCLGDIYCNDLNLDWNTLVYVKLYYYPGTDGETIISLQSFYNFSTANNLYHIFPELNILKGAGKKLLISCLKKALQEGVFKEENKIIVDASPTNVGKINYYGKNKPKKLNLETVIKVYQDIGFEIDNPSKFDQDLADEEVQLSATIKAILDKNKV